MLDVGNVLSCSGLIVADDDDDDLEFLEAKDEVAIYITNTSSLITPRQSLPLKVVITGATLAFTWRT